MNNYRKAVLKRKLEYAGMLPFVLAGKLYGTLFPLKQPTSVFLFLPSADIGGAIKVNADVAACVQDHRPLIIFSKKPKNNGYKHLFDIPGVRQLDLHKKIDNKLYHFINFFYRGVLAAWINAVENPIVFGGEGLFFYKMLPHLKKSARTIELCHLDTWFPYTIAFIDFISVRAFSSIALMEKARTLYRAYGIPEQYDRRLVFIENKIDIPPAYTTSNEKLEVVFIGRGAPQKRIHLTAAIAEKIHQAGVPVHFSFVGDVDKVIDISRYPFCTFYGNVSNQEKMEEIFRRSDVLILTSAYEGLPLVVMQTMAHGKVVLSTAINAIPDYVRHLENGLLIYSTDEAQIVEEGVQLLQLLVKDPSLTTRLGARSREIAREKFGGEEFCRKYRALFFPAMPADGWELH